MEACCSGTREGGEDEEKHEGEHEEDEKSARRAMRQAIPDADWLLKSQG